MEDKNKGIYLAFLAVGLWATLGVGFKLAVSRVDSFVVTLWVSIIAAVFLFLFLWWRGKLGKLWSAHVKHWKFLIPVGVLGLGVQQILYLKGYQLLPASEVVIIFYLYPLLMVLLSGFIFGEKTSWKSYLFTLIGFSGVYVMISKGSLLSISLSTGVIVTLLAALCFALFSVLIKHNKIDAEIGMFFYHFWGAIFLLLMIPFFSFSTSFTLGEIGGMIYLAIFPTAIAFLVWNKALSLVPTHKCSNLALLIPVLSLVLIVLILGEEIHVT